MKKLIDEMDCLFKQVAKYYPIKDEKNVRLEWNDLVREVKNCIKPPVIKSLPEPDEIRMKARELDEKDFAQWMYEIQKGNVL